MVCCQHWGSSNTLLTLSHVALKLERKIDKELEEKLEKIWFVQGHFAEPETQVSWAWNRNKTAAGGRHGVNARKEGISTSADGHNKEKEDKAASPDAASKIDQFGLHQHLDFKDL